MNKLGPTYLTKQCYLVCTLCPQKNEASVFCYNFETCMYGFYLVILPCEVLRETEL